MNISVANRQTTVMVDAPEFIAFDGSACTVPVLALT